MSKKRKRRKRKVSQKEKDNYILHHTLIRKNRMVIELWHDQMFEHHKRRLYQLAIFLQNQRRNEAKSK
jgi:hypothetical protein